MKKNKLLVPLVAILLVAGVVAGVVYLPQLNKKPVPVYSVGMVGYTDYYGGNPNESYGMVKTDKVQPLYVSPTQTVTQVLVYSGQQVKKGDVLVTYDTTLSDLAVERKDLANQQLEVKLKTAQEELVALKKMKPIVYKPGSNNSSSAATNYSKSPADKSMLDKVYSTKTTGKSRTSPLYLWLGTTTQVDDALIDYIFTQADKNLNQVYVVFQMSSGNQPNREFSVHTGVKFTKVMETIPDPTEPPTEPSTPPSTPPEPSIPEDPSTPPESSVPPESSEPTQTPPPSETTAPPQPAEAADTTAVTETTVRAATKFVGYSMSFFEPPSNPAEDQGTVEWNDGYTKAELESMKADKQAQIKQLQFDIKMGKAELKIMKKEASDGKITAEFNGVVQDVQDPAMALENGEPLLKVTGGGGYYVEGTVSELALETLKIGQSVTINSWDTGAIYTGEVVEIGSYPAEDQGFSYGSTNLSFYPYTVYIDGEADLMEGYYVSITYQTEEQAAGMLYLQNAFIRRDGNRSYVYVRSPEGLLEKRYLNAGVSTDGYMTPIYGGITEEDFLAFPYGSDVVAGAETFEGTDQDLYGY